MLWLSDKWKTKGIQHVCRQVSTQSKRTTKRYPWAWVGSLAFGVFFGYGLPKFFKSRKDSSIVKAKSVPRDDMSSNSGSPPRSVTFNFIADAVEIAAPAVVKTLKSRDDTRDFLGDMLVPLVPGRDLLSPRTVWFLRMHMWWKML